MISKDPVRNLKKGVVLGYHSGTESGVKNERPSKLGYEGGVLVTGKELFWENEALQEGTKAGGWQLSQQGAASSLMKSGGVEWKHSL